MERRIPLRAHTLSETNMGPTVIGPPCVHHDIVTYSPQSAVSPRSFIDVDAFLTPGPGYTPSCHGAPGSHDRIIFVEETPQPHFVSPACIAATPSCHAAEDGIAPMGHSAIMGTPDCNNTQQQQTPDCDAQEDHDDDHDDARYVPSVAELVAALEDARSNMTALRDALRSAHESVVEVKAENASLCHRLVNSNVALAQTMAELDRMQFARCRRPKAPSSQPRSSGPLASSV